MSHLVLLLGACRPAPNDDRPDRLALASTAPASWLATWHRPGEVVVGFGEAEVAISLRAWGSSDGPRIAEAVVPTRAGRRTSYARPGLVEWWEVVPGGLHHGFTVEAAPDTGDLVVELALRGATAEVDHDGRSATWTTTGGHRLRYEGLSAWDESGAALPASMEVVRGGLLLVVDVAGAVGAVTIDPVLSWDRGETGWTVTEHATAGESVPVLGVSVALDDIYARTVT